MYEWGMHTGSYGSRGARRLHGSPGRPPNTGRRSKVSRLRRWLKRGRDGWEAGHLGGRHGRKALLKRRLARKAYRRRWQR